MPHKSTFDDLWFRHHTSVVLCPARSLNKLLNSFAVALQIRFYQEGEIVVGRPIPLSSDNAHHLVNVLRVKDGQTVFCFNGKEEYECQMAMPNKRICAAVPLKVTRVLRSPAVPVELMLSLVKHEAMHEAVSNATQMGIDSLQPVLSDRCVHKNVRQNKMELIAQYSSAQCDRIDVPKIKPLKPLRQAIADLCHKDNDTDKTNEAGGANEACKAKPLVLWANELASRNDPMSFVHSFHNTGAAVGKALRQAKPLCVLIGPEGGFSPQEVAMLNDCPNVVSIGISQNILRTETAVTAALQMVNLLLHKSL